MQTFILRFFHSCTLSFLYLSYIFPVSDPFILHLSILAFLLFLHPYILIFFQSYILSFLHPSFLAAIHSYIKLFWHFYIPTSFFSYNLQLCQKQIVACRKRGSDCTHSLTDVCDLLINEIFCWFAVVYSTKHHWFPLKIPTHSSSASYLGKQEMLKLCQRMFPQTHHDFPFVHTSSRHCFVNLSIHTTNALTPCNS